MDLYLREGVEANKPGDNENPLPPPPNNNQSENRYHAERSKSTANPDPQKLGDKFAWSDRTHRYWLPSYTESPMYIFAVTLLA